MLADTLGTAFFVAAAIGWLAIVGHLLGLIQLPKWRK